ncbi:hypothetical protein V7306_25640, partial [Neobacillus vireti]
MDLNNNRRKNTYGLKVEQSIKKAPKQSTGELIQYYITEDGLPMYEVNRWIETISFNSYLTGEAYSYALLDFLRFLKSKEIHYKKVQSKAVIESYVQFLLYGDTEIT